MRIPVTKPYLPDISEYKRLTDRIWTNGWLTNQGPLLTEFEERLADFLEVEHLAVVSNGTAALQLSLHSLPENGEIITTPYSYVATTSSIVWERMKPVFADIDPNTACISPEEVESKITSETTAILATHVYGNPCDLNSLQAVAEKHHIKLIYDGAHAFGTRFRNKSIGSFGDLTTLSFHSTKIFHSVNGGAVICKNEEDKERIVRYRNFGHVGVNAFDGVGINAKMSEFHAAMGLLNLKKAPDLIEKRKEQWLFYAYNIRNTSLKTISIKDFSGYNCAYFPLFFGSEEKLKEAITSASKNGIELRRYFNPALNLLDYVEYSSCPIAEDLSARVCCLPLYHTITSSEQEEVLKVVLKNE